MLHLELFCPLKTEIIRFVLISSSPLSNRWPFFLSQTAEEWQGVFWLTFAILVGGTVIFCVLLSGERQEWDKATTEPTDDAMESQNASGR